MVIERSSEESSAIPGSQASRLFALASRRNENIALALSCGIRRSEISTDHKIVGIFPTVVKRFIRGLSETVLSEFHSGLSTVLSPQEDELKGASFGSLLGVGKALISCVPRSLTYGPNPSSGNHSGQPTSQDGNEACFTRSQTGK